MNGGGGAQAAGWRGGSDAEASSLLLEPGTLLALLSCLCTL